MRKSQKWDGPYNSHRTDSNGEPTGVATLAYLFYEAVLNDDKVEIDKRLLALKDFLNKSKEPSDCKVDPVQIYEMIQLFFMLSNKLQAIDFTIETRSTIFALSSVAKTLYTLLFRRGKKQVEGARVTIDKDTKELGEDVYFDAKKQVEGARVTIDKDTKELGEDV